jgi:hypothetical protein
VAVQEDDGRTVPAVAHAQHRLADVDPVQREPLEHRG